MKRFAALIAASLLAYLCTGLYIVQPDEQAVVRRFGKLQQPLREPGLHIGLPAGLDRVDRIKPRAVQQVAIGPVRVGNDAVGVSPAQYLTGDRNLVNVQATVQYRIADPAAYLLVCPQVDQLVAHAGEAVLAQVLAGRSVDHILTEGKQQVALRARDALQWLADHYGIGIAIRSMDIVQVQPPPEVADAFANVTSADRQREQQIHQARSYFDRSRELAVAEGQRMRDEASAYRDQVIRQAEGEADRFEKLLAEYERAPELTSQRLYLEAMADTLPRFRSKLIVDAGSDLDLSILGEESP